MNYSQHNAVLQLSGPLAVNDMEASFHAVRKSDWFVNIVLPSLGLPRALEELRRLPAEGLLKLSTEDPVPSVRRVGDLLAERYKLKALGKSSRASAAALLPYLVLSGVPLSSLDDCVSPPGEKATTARQLHTEGVMSIISAPQLPWVDRWDAGSCTLVNMPPALLYAVLMQDRHESSTWQFLVLFSFFLCFSAMR